MVQIVTDSSTLYRPDEDCMRLDKFAVKRTMKSTVDAIVTHLKTCTHL